MTVADELLATLPAGQPLEVRIGASWTAVVIDVDGRRRCGLASTLMDHDHHRERPAVGNAGHLADLDSGELAELARSDSLLERCVGMAAINALLPLHPDQWMEGNAGDLIGRYGTDQRVALIGHFPFVEQLRQQVGQLWVLELSPQEDDLPASAAPEVIPQADLLAITGTTLINRTFDHLMALRRPGARVMVLGPSTPLSPVLFDRGVHLVSGAVVEKVDAVLQAVSQGANFRQVRRAGVRLVTMARAA